MSLTIIEIRDSALLAHVARSPLLKRAVDIVGALATFTLLAPIFLVIAIAIKMESSGPVFFRQTRIGKNGVPFTMVKFRSMRVGADALHAKMQGATTSQSHGNGSLHSALLDRRASAVLERAHWRHVARRSAPGAPVGSGEVCPERPRSSAREARHHLPVAVARSRDA